MKRKVRFGLAALALGVSATAGITPAAAEGVARECSEYVYSGLTGVVVFTPSGNRNTNCDLPGPAQAVPGGGGARVVQCREIYDEPEIFGPDVRGNLVFTPSSGYEDESIFYKNHCKF